MGSNSVITGVLLILILGENDHSVVMVGQTNVIDQVLPGLK